jgi:uncharacterized membrane protein
MGFMRPRVAASPAAALERTPPLPTRTPLEAARLWLLLLLLLLLPLLLLLLVVVVVVVVVVVLLVVVVVVVLSLAWPFAAASLDSWGSGGGAALANDSKSAERFAL